VLKGSAEHRETDTDGRPILGPRGEFLGQELFEVVTTEVVDARELMATDPAMLGRVELAATVLLPRGLKVRISGGMNFPGTHGVQLMGLYFFGRQ
jgi:hypothetical protein